MLLGLGIVSVVAAYFVRDYANAPLPETFASYAGYTPQEMKTIFLEAVLAAVEDNRRTLRQKAFALKAGMVVIGLGALAVIVVVAAGFDSRVT